MGVSTFYIAATDRMSWGRGTRDWEAIAHAILHGGDQVKNVVLFEVTCPEGSTEVDVSVNEMGAITAPKGSEVKELGNFDANVMVIKFHEFRDAVERAVDNG